MVVLAAWLTENTKSPCGFLLVRIFEIDRFVCLSLTRFYEGKDSHSEIDNSLQIVVLCSLFVSSCHRIALPRRGTTETFIPQRVINFLDCVPVNSMMRIGVLQEKYFREMGIADEHLCMVFISRIDCESNLLVKVYQVNRLNLTVL